MACIKCGNEVEAVDGRAYCAACFGEIRDMQTSIAQAQHPGPGLFLDGQFVKPEECPKSVYSEPLGKNVCGLCGSAEIEMGYGLGSGHGMGSYNFCTDCNSFLDFVEDRK